MAYDFFEIIVEAGKAQDPESSLNVNPTATTIAITFMAALWPYYLVKSRLMKGD